MTKKLEELLNIAPNDDSTEVLPEEIEPAKSLEVVDKVEKELKAVDTIESALAGVENLTANDKEMDTIATKAEETFDNLMDLGMNVEARFSGQIFDTASKMLTITLNAKQAKIDKKLKMVELQLRKKALDARIDRDMGKFDGTYPEDGEATVLSRNELLDRILKKDNK
jgi:FtsZ-binding cell division protein ZapB